MLEVKAYLLPDDEGLFVLLSRVEVYRFKKEFAGAIAEVDVPFDYTRGANTVCGWNNHDDNPIKRVIRIIGQNVQKHFSLSPDLIVKVTVFRDERPKTGERLFIWKKGGPREYFYKF